jgi:hypothetical protein
MPRDEDYFTETEAQSKLRTRVRVKQSGGGYTAGQTGIVHETGYDQEGESYYLNLFLLHVEGSFGREPEPYHRIVSTRFDLNQR